MRYEVLTPSEAFKKFRHMGAAALLEAGIPGMKLGLHKEFYDSESSASVCFVIGAFLNDGTPVGFSSVLLSSHNTDQVFATNDVVYVMPEDRFFGTGAWLVKKSEEEARRRGAKCFLWSVGFNSPLDCAFSKRAPYRILQRTFLKEL